MLKGNRKFILGGMYLAGGLATIALALMKQPDAVAEVGIALVSMAPGVGAIVWGNVSEHRATLANGKVAVTGKPT